MPESEAENIAEEERPRRQSSKRNEVKKESAKKGKAKRPNYL